jgi:hypothetical protein
MRCQGSSPRIDSVIGAGVDILPVWDVLLIPNQVDQVDWTRLLLAHGARCIVQDAGLRFASVFPELFVFMAETELEEVNFFDVGVGFDLYLSLGLLQCFHLCVSSLSHPLFRPFVCIRVLVPTSPIFVLLDIVCSLARDFCVFCTFCIVALTCAVPVLLHSPSLSFNGSHLLLRSSHLLPNSPFLTFVTLSVSPALLVYYSDSTSHDHTTLLYLV